jgi:hypothetical protein
VGRTLLDAMDALERPVCLIVDDAQWVDEPYARALRFAVRRMMDRGFLFTAATRPQPNGAAALFDGFAAAAANHARIDLSALTVSDTQALGEHLLGHAISRRTAARLTEATQGSPLLLTVLLGQVRETFAQALHPAGWDLPETALAPLASAVSAALDGATPSARSASELIAVLRDPLPLPVAGSIAARLGMALDVPGAVSRGLVLGRERDGVVWVEPAHALLADAVASGLSLERRGDIHRVAAEVLTGHRALRHRVEAAEASDPALVDELLSEALAAADRGQAEQAMSYARSAVHLAADGEHERILELRTLCHDAPGALDLTRRRTAAEAITPDERAIRTHIAEALPKVLMAMGDFPGVLDHLGTARAQIAECPRPEEIADPALRWMAEPEEHLVRLLGWALNSAAHARRPELFPPLTEELDALLAGHESPAAVDAPVARSRVFVLGGDIERARADLARATGLVRRFPSSWTAGFARTISAHILFLAESGRSRSRWPTPPSRSRWTRRISPAGRSRCGHRRSCAPAAARRRASPSGCAPLPRPIRASQAPTTAICRSWPARSSRGRWAARRISSRRQPTPRQRRVAPPPLAGSPTAWTRSRRSDGRRTPARHTSAARRWVSGGPSTARCAGSRAGAGGRGRHRRRRGRLPGSGGGRTLPVPAGDRGAGRGPAAGRDRAGESGGAAGTGSRDLPATGRGHLSDEDRDAARRYREPAPDAGGRGRRRRPAERADDPRTAGGARAGGGDDKQGDRGTAVRVGDDRQLPRPQHPVETGPALAPRTARARRATEKARQKLTVFRPSGGGQPHRPLPS